MQIQDVSSRIPAQPSTMPPPPPPASEQPPLPEPEQTQPTESGRTVDVRA